MTPEAPEPQEAVSSETAPASEETAASEASDDHGAEDTRPMPEPVVPGAISASAPPDEPTRPQAAAVPAVAGPSTFALVFGGLAAGAIGFLVATFAVPEGWPNPPREPDAEILAALAAQSDEIAALTSRIEDLSAAAPAEVTGPDLGPVSAQIATATQEIEALSADVSALAARVEVIENRPAPEVQLPELGYQQELDAFRNEMAAVTAAARAEVEAAEARAREVEAEAAAAAEAAARRAARAEIAAALESGAPFADALARIPEAPAALSAVAESGVPTLATLQESFPDVARDVLRQSVVVPEDAGVMERASAFLRRHTNARSLSPQEGDDADAILSRAEAALAGGDLATALSELAGLPDGSRGPMADWLALAETRQSASEALAGMAEIQD